MPVKSLSTSVLAWPKKEKVESGLGAWARTCARSVPELLAIGFIGSYARGDWGVGSDLDLVLILERSDMPFESRPLSFDTSSLPVPADLLVYTREELTGLLVRGGRFAQTLRRDIQWAWRRRGYQGLPS